jgi:predicted Zn-dependent protease
LPAQYWQKNPTLLTLPPFLTTHPIALSPAVDNQDNVPNDKTIIDNAIFNVNYALFLTNIRKNHDQAEAYYKKSLELEPDNAIFNGNYAQFLFMLQ